MQIKKHIKFHHKYKEHIMKTILSFIVILFAIFAITCDAQTTVTKYIKFAPNQEVDSVQYYEIYLQKQPNNSSFSMIDNDPYSPMLSDFHVADIPHVIGQVNDYVYTIEVDIIESGWIVAGVIAYNDVRSVLAVSGSTHIKKKPGKPDSVRIENTP